MLSKLLVVLREWWFIGLFLVVVLSVDWLTPYDNTDDIENKERSGMSLYIDHLTGCQYLKAGLFGGMTARRDGEGNHIGCN